MDDDGLNMRNWGYYEPSFKGNLGLQLMSTVVQPLPNGKPPLFSTNANGTNGNVDTNANGNTNADDQANVKPPSFFTANGHHQTALMMMGNNVNNGGVQSQPSTLQMNYLRDCWMNQQREKFHNMFPFNPNFNGIPPSQEPSLLVQFHHNQMQVFSQPDPNSNPNPISSPPPPLPSVGMEIGESNTKKNRKRNSNNSNPKAPKPKMSKKSPKENGNSSVGRAKPAVKKSMDMIINGMNMDISSIPIPICSCTGTPQQCYRWGCGGWQSACCTTTISIHPLPMSTKRRGARIAGRKMSQGAFKKVLEKLASEGYDFGNSIDLRNHWAKHGTNKFVTIR